MAGKRRGEGRRAGRVCSGAPWSPRPLTRQLVPVVEAAGHEEPKQAAIHLAQIHGSRGVGVRPGGGGGTVAGTRCRSSSGAATCWLRPRGAPCVAGCRSSPWAAPEAPASSGALRGGWGAPIAMLNVSLQLAGCAAHLGRPPGGGRARAATRVATSINREAIGVRDRREKIERYAMDAPPAETQLSMRRRHGCRS